MKVHPSVKLLQSQGLGSRKQCEIIFWNSEIFLNGSRMNPETDVIALGDHVVIDGTPYEMRQHVYLLLNKPAGFEISHKPTVNPSVFTLIPKHYLERGVQAAGRLDIDTTGLLLMSDDGQFIHRVISGKAGEKYEIEKLYRIVTADPISQKDADKLLQGVELIDEPELIAASRVELINETTLSMGITTGKYHQVKRMIAALGNRVVELHRFQVGPYLLPDNLAEGQFIEISPS